MKKLLFILLMLPAIMLAAPIDPNLAQQVAQNFINSTSDSINAKHSNDKPRRLKRVANQIDDAQSYYIFNNEDGGFVIVSADDIAIPILGYSSTGSLDLVQMPENLRWWLSEYEREIKWAIQQEIEPSNETKSEWERLLKAPPAKQSNVVVAPLIKTEWSQGGGYNSKCPYDANSGLYCQTGCVATAMAQIMKFWEYPKSGRGSNSYTHKKYGSQYADFEHTTYDWKNMPNDLGLSSTSVQIDAVATLMYHCGVSVNMNYGVTESEANQFATAAAFKDYFLYSDEACFFSKDDFSEAIWNEKIKLQLLLGRPVFYGGRGSSGEVTPKSWTDY